MNVDLLPEGARAFFPAYDGDGLTVTLPAASADDLSSRQVFDGVVAPILSSIGMQDPEYRMRIPQRGMEMPQADLGALADITCREVDGMENANAQKICAALRSGQADDEVDRLLLAGEGMTFAQYKADIERLEIEYVFPQVERGIPIEHVGIIAARWAEETVTLVTGRVFTEYKITNSVVLTPEDAGNRVFLELYQVEGVSCPDRRPPDRIELLLLPYGEADGLPALRFVYRMPVYAQWNLIRALFYVWMDAENGSILQLTPLVDADVSARGVTYDRAPDLLPTTKTWSFQVDKAEGGKYVLRLSGVFGQPDRLGDDDYDDDELSIDENSGGSSPTFANFDMAPHNQAAAAVCDDSGNITFEQVDLFATLYRYRQQAISAGLFTPFPDPEMYIDYAVGSVPGCTGMAEPGMFGGVAGLVFQGCEVVPDPACDDGMNLINLLQDHTYVAHEMGHAMNQRQYTDRPCCWCVDDSLTCPGTCPETCPLPHDAIKEMFHDFADSWAHALENTNCFGGWRAKNDPTPDANPNCSASHVNDSGFPRLSEVGSPGDLSGNPTSPVTFDHFPESRVATVFTDPYNDMQIAAAALWSLRQGMRSKCLPSGTPQYFVRFVRALRTTGWYDQHSNPNSITDLEVYRGLVDLAVNITNQWVSTAGFKHNGPHTTNKVTSGFSRSGIFMIPWYCLDGDVDTGDADTGDDAHCPVASGGENGGDAVIDIDDNDVGDDPMVPGAPHLKLPEVDYLERDGGNPPTFHVWTGPAYRFDAWGDAVFPDPAPCNTQFLVDVANDEGFSVNLVQSNNGDFSSVNVDPSDTSSPRCYGSWTIPLDKWNILDDAGRLYYRVQTADSSEANERKSWMPGRIFTVPPPYAVINDTGQP